MSPESHAPLTLRSDQFEDGQPIPQSAAHPSAGGKNESPQLSWTGVPEGTKSLALSCWDPDAPTSVGFCHWIRFGMSPSLTSLDEGAGRSDGDWGDGFCDWGESAYGGMAPPAGDEPHHYQFTLYALNQEADLLGLDEKATYARFRFSIRNNIIATGTLTGTYEVRQ